MHSFWISIQYKYKGDGSDTWANHFLYFGVAERKFYMHLFKY